MATKTVLISALALCLVTGTAAQTQPPDYDTCKEGSDLFDPPECPDQDGTGLPTYFPFPYDCTQYFECTNTIARCIKCAEGTIWDQNLTVCNHPSVVNCTIVTTPVPTTPTTTTPTTTTPTTTTPTTTTPTTTTPTTTTPTTTTPTTTTPTTTTPTTTTPTTTTEPSTSTTDDPIHWICPEGYLGTMRHPYDCRLFYNCDPGRRPCLFPCQEGLYYNPVNDQCDFPFNVPDCVDGTPPPTSTTPKVNDDKQTDVNYRNVVRSSFVDTVKYVSNMLRGKTSEDNPCDGIRAYLE